MCTMYQTKLGIVNVVIELNSIALKLWRRMGTHKVLDSAYNVMTSFTLAGAETTEYYTIDLKRKRVNVIWNAKCVQYHVLNAIRCNILIYIRAYI